MKIREIALPHLLAIAITLFNAATLFTIFWRLPDYSALKFLKEYQALLGSFLGVVGAYLIAIYTIGRTVQIEREKIAVALFHAINMAHRKILLGLATIGTDIPDFDIVQLIKNDNYIPESILNNYTNQIDQTQILDSILHCTNYDFSDDRIMIFIEKMETMKNEHLPTLGNIFEHLEIMSGRIKLINNGHFPPTIINISNCLQNAKGCALTMETFGAELCSTYGFDPHPFTTYEEATNYVADA